MVAPTDPGPVVRDPELQAALVRLLRVVGPLGLLGVSDVIVPTVSLGNVVQPEIQILQPSFIASNVFSEGEQTAPASGTLMADTGQLAAGIFDIVLQFSSSEDSANMGYLIQHRNAANAANLMEFNNSFGLGAGGPQVLTLAYEFALNERLRILSSLTPTAGRRFTCVIFARERT